MVLTRSQTNNVGDTFQDAVTTQPTENTTQNGINYQPNTTNTENHTVSNSNTQQHTTNYNQNPNLKIPQFWTYCPQAWFLQIDMQFQLHNIEDDTVKYQYIVTSLSQEAILKILDIVQNPPLTQKYETIKKILCERFSLSDERRLEEIMSDAQLGDRKPSELFRELTIMGGPLSFVSRELIFKFWQRKLPRDIQIHLTSSGLSSVDEKVILADKIYQMSSPNIAVVNSTEASPSELIRDLTQLTTTLNENINKLSLNIDAINRAGNNPDRNNFSKNFTRSFQNRKPNSQYVCWYHQRFGNKALKCEESCKFFNNFQSKSLN